MPEPVLLSDWNRPGWKIVPIYDMQHNIVIKGMGAINQWRIISQ